MPTLPTLTVTDAQMTRLMAVFKDAPTYKAWLREQLKTKVISAETEAIRSQAQADMEAKRVEVSNDLETAG